MSDFRRKRNNILNSLFVYNIFSLDKIANQCIHIFLRERDVEKMRKNKILGNEKSNRKFKKKLALISTMLIIASIALCACSDYSATTSNTTVTSSTNTNVGSNTVSSNKTTSSSSKTTGHTCIVDGCYKTATHYLDGTSGDEWYCDEHYEWMAGFANEIIEHSNKNSSESSRHSYSSHSCAICNKSASYEDPYDSGTWYCYEHYCGAIEWYSNH